MIRVDPSQTPHDAQQSPVVRWQLCQHLADIRYGEEEVGATIGVAPGVVRIQEFDHLLVGWLPCSHPCLSQILPAVEDQRRKHGGKSWCPEKYNLILMKKKILASVLSKIKSEKNILIFNAAAKHLYVLELWKCFINNWMLKVMRFKWLENIKLITFTCFGNI